MKTKPGKQTKTGKKPHTLGEFQGTGVRNPMGTVKMSYMDYSGEQMKGKRKPPKSLA